MHIKKGFTLIELLVVVAIIAIMVAMIYSNLGNARLNALITQRTSGMRQIQEALEFYFDDHGYYPYTTGGTKNQYRSACTGLSGVTAVNQDDLAPGLTPKYIQHIPIDPGTDGVSICCYVYAVTPDGQEYKVIEENCGPSGYYNNSPGLLDPARDGGTDSCTLDKTDYYAWQLHSKTSYGACL